MRATSIQIQIQERTKPEALEHALALIDKARGSDLILLPELWPCGYFAFDRYAGESERLDGPLLRILRDKAEELKCYLFMGSFVERDAGRLYNTSVLIDPRGQVAARYRKVHLFGHGSDERRLLSAGTDIAVAATPWGKMGLATCYDLRFPELFRGMVDRGAEIFLVASAWPDIRRESWLLFNRARAHENLAWLLSCNCAGESQGRKFAGHSQFVPPSGIPAAVAGVDEELLSAEIDPSAVQAARKEFSALADRVIRIAPLEGDGWSRAAMQPKPCLET